MAVKAEFQADFKSFVDGVDKADAKLAHFGGTAEKVSGSTKQWSNAINQADSVLSKAGINIGPTARALDELTAAAGKSATEIGLVGTAGLAVGAAMAGWNLGRVIAEFFGLDKAIGDATASLLGYGDVVAETAGSQQDVINAAIKNGADATVTYSQAIQYNTDFHRKRIAALKDAAKADEHINDAMTELNSVGGTLNDTLNTMSGTVVEAVKYYLDAGVSQSALATAYGLTAVQVKAVAESIKAAQEADKAWLAQLHAEAEEAERVAAILSGVLAKAHDDTAAANARATAELTKQTDANAALIIANDKARESLNATALAVDPLTAAWIKMNDTLATLAAAKQGDIDISALQQQAYNEYTDALLKDADAVDRETQAFWKARDAVNAKSGALQEATKQTGVFMQQLHMLINDPQIAGFFGFDAKGAAAKTLHGFGNDITPEMAAAMASGQFINTAGVGAVRTGAQVNNVFHVNGTAGDVARTISAEIMRTVKAGNKVPSS